MLKRKKADGKRRQMTKVKYSGDPVKNKALMESGTPRDYYYKVFNAKKNNEPWVKDIPVDLNIYWCESGRFDIFFKSEEKNKEKLLQPFDKKQEILEEDDLPF